MSEIKKMVIILLFMGIILELTAQLVFNLSFIYSVTISLLFCMLLFVILLGIFSQTSKQNQVFFTEEETSEQSNADINAIKYKKNKL